MREKVFLVHPRFCRIFLCVFAFLGSLDCTPMVRCADTHSLVTGDMPFPVLVDTKFWHVIKYCSVVPALVQDISVVPPFPADPAALSWDLSWGVFFPPMMKTISRGHAAGLETPPDPSRVQDTPPQHNPFPCLLPPLRCAAQKESLLTTCTVVLWNFRGRGRTPLSACWGRLDCREPFSPISRTLVQFGHSSPQHKHFEECTRDRNIFFLPFLCVERFSLPDLSLWVTLL